jgi:AcrR family transcriptional regulator
VERTDGHAPGPPRRTGRPPRISREQIARAAVEVGLSDLTLKAVAEHLGVSVAALYHHVDGKDDLMRLAADRSATRLRLPADVGQHWAVWLLEWAAYNHDAFVADPALLEQYLEGAISPEVIARNAQSILEVLVRQGFGADDALEAYEVVTTCALGTAINAIRDSRSAARGRPRAADEIRQVAVDDPEHLALVHEAVTRRTAPGADRATDRFRAVITGIAALRGDDADEVAAVLAGTEPATGA